jgi:sugar phosphate isomerase/epimerase
MSSFGLRGVRNGEAGTKFSLAALTILDQPPPAAVEIAAACGYDKLGIRLIPTTPGGTFYDLMNDAAMLRATRERMHATGISIADLEVVALTPETAVGGFDRFLEVGANLDAEHVLVAAYDPEPARLIENFGEFCDAAAAFGMTADIEFMPWTNVRNLADAIDLLTAVDRPNAGVIIDALHFDRSGSSIDDIARVRSDWLHYWQLCDAPADRPSTVEELLHTARAERQFPGEGGLDLVPLTRAIPSDLLISVEVPTDTLALTLGARERARHALDCTRRVLAAAAGGASPG